MDNLTGQIISHYRILEVVGQGGMGVVYKAEDLNLSRTVAIKFLHRHLSSTEEEKARFLQEARTAATLSHANICVVHDIQEHEGQLFLVMDYVEGEGLRRLRGKLTLKQTIDVGIQIAEGLGAAHEKGVVHRDIKPENVVVRHDGTVQILDFGLARLRGASRITKEGTTMGTIGYMSPEQVQGLDVDHRSDIFSYGVMMYELLSGQPPFRSEHETALIYEILNYDPPALSDSRRDIDPELSRIVMGCLEKDRDERIQSIKEVARELRQFKRTSERRITTAKVPTTASVGSVPVAPTPQAGPSKGVTRILKSRALAWTCAGILVLAVTLLVRDRLTQSPPPLPSVQALIPIPANLIPPQSLGGGHFALSPDGSTLAYVAGDSAGADSIWLHSLRSGRASGLTGTRGAQFPFWSPDSRTLGFFQGGKLKRIEASGGTPYTIAEAPDPRGGAWGVSDTIVFAPVMSGPILKVSARGGTAEKVTSPDTARRGTHRWPVFRPDGRHFLFFGRSAGEAGDPATDSIYVGSLDGTRQKPVMLAQSDAQYAGDCILSMRGSEILAQPFDSRKLEAAGSPAIVAEGVGYNSRFSRSHFSVSQTGILVYQSHTPMGLASDLFTADRMMKHRRFVGTYEVWNSIRISPDNRKIALGIFELSNRNTDIWTIDLSTSARTRLTFDPGIDFSPIWSPDGRRIAFCRRASSQTQLMLKNADGSGGEELVREVPSDVNLWDWSPDGEFILFSSGSDLWGIPLQGDRMPFRLEETRPHESDGRFAPNGKWIAYDSDETGREEIYVRPFPGPGSKWQVTSEGGYLPRWLPDGNEILYVNKDGIASARVELGAASLNVLGTRQFGSSGGSSSVYDISRNGDQVVLGIANNPSTVEPFTIVVNWTERIVRTPP